MISFFKLLFYPSFYRKIKTWHDGVDKILERYSFGRKGKWFILLGLNPSQEVDDFIDATNLNNCNTLLRDFKDQCKGYYLINLSSHVESDKTNLLPEHFTSKHSMFLYKFLKKRVRKHKLLLFYGGQVVLNKTHKLGLTKEILNVINEYFDKENLFISVGNKELSNEGNMISAFNLFTHSGMPTLKDNLRFRIAEEKDRNAIGLPDPPLD